MKPAGLAANYYFGGGGGTSLTTGALTVVIAAIAGILFLPKKYIIVPLILASLMINGQVVVAGAHLMISRLVIGASLLRICLAGRIVGWTLTKVDKIFLTWAISNAVAYTILWGEVGAAINRLGFLFSTVGMYWVLRALLQDRRDFLIFAKALAISAVIIAGFMAKEHATGHNGFAMFGAQEISDVRDGRVRAQGPFAHSIIAGTFGATLIPLLIALWWQEPKHRIMAAMGMGGAAVITLASSSSTPIMTLGAGIAALCCWPLREKMKSVRWAIVVVLIGLQLAMNAPVWFVLARLGGSLGGTGWHRAQLINQFVRHVGDWWLIGTRDNASWGLDMWDSINAYVNAGLGGGAGVFLLFVYLIVSTYKKVGRARASLRDQTTAEKCAWAMGSTLFAHCVAFFGIIYFDQSSTVWYALLALVAGLPGIVQEEGGKESVDEPGPVLAGNAGSPVTGEPGFGELQWWGT